VRHAVADNLFRWLIAALLFQVVLPESVIDASEKPPDSAPTSDLRSQIRSRIEQLGDASRAVRSRAEQSLIALGPEILPLLPPPDLLKSASVRVAIRRLRVRLEHDAAELSLHPSNVTLTGQMAVSKIAKEVEKQTGNTISTQPLSLDQLNQLIDLDLETVSFWQVIDRLNSARLDASFDKETGILTLSQQTTRDSRRISKIDRAFRIDASPLTRQAVNNTGTLLSSQIRILCEPRLRPLFLRYTTSNFQLLVDDGKQSIEPFNTGARVEVPLGNGGREADVSVSFLLPENLVETASLRGKAELLVAASEQPIAFREIGRSKRVSRRRGGVTVTVNEVRFDGSKPRHHNARVQLRVNYDLGAHAFESHQTWVFHNRVYLVDSNGKQHGPNGGFSTLFQGDGSVGIEYSFEDLTDNPENWKFVYVAPTLLINVEIPIDLPDIPIVKSTSTQK